MTDRELVDLLDSSIRAVANQLSQGARLPFRDELYSVGWVGALVARDKFEGDRGASFKTYAINNARFYMKHWLRDHTSIVKVPSKKFDYAMTLLDRETLTTEQSALLKAISYHWKGIDDLDLYSPNHISYSLYSPEVDFDLIADYKAAIKKAQLSDTELRAVCYQAYGYSIEEISILIGMSRFSASNLISKTKKKLRESL